MQTMMRLAAATACLVAAAAAPAVAAGPPGSVATGGASIAPRQEIVRVLGTHVARARPHPAGARVGLVDAHRPITGANTVLPLLARATDENGASWLKVRLPGRVLGRRAPVRVGWISAVNTRLSATAWRIVVDLSDRRAAVYRDGRRLRSFRVVIGAAATPTPVGEHFVEENVRMPAGSAGAPYALALSARSGVLQEFAGGPGQVALHGRVGVGGTLGTAVSHGCVRLDDAAITWLAGRISPGAPVTVVR